MYSYDFCICCVSGDEKFAEPLAKSLESYRIPDKLKLPDPSLDYRHILRDYKGEQFDEAQKNQLTACRQLILVCTPRTRDSEAALARLRYFESVRSLGAIIPVLAEAEPPDSFPPFFIREKVTEHILPDMTVERRTETVEPVAADLRGSTPRARKAMLRYETIRIAATSLELVPDMLIRRHEARRKRRAALTAAAVCAVSLAVSGIFGWYGMKAAKAADIYRRQTSETVTAVNRLFTELPEAFKDNPEAAASIEEAIREAEDSLRAIGSSALPAEEEVGNTVSPVERGDDR